MDTIQIAIKLNENKIRNISYEEIRKLPEYIFNIQSPYGHKYCNCIEISLTGNLIVKLSYPRYFAGLNAFLISNEKQCMEVQGHFSMAIRDNQLLRDSELILNRVDIPFTFNMGPNYSFDSYEKIYQIFDYVYRKKNFKAKPKAFTDIENFKPETLIYADTLNSSAYNKKITIYNQHENIKVKTSDEISFAEVETKYNDLTKRMRIEVSKRIRRKGFSILEFSQFNIFREYSKKYAKEIIENFCDLNEIENFYNEKAKKLSDKLLGYREQTNFFTYEGFIYKEIQHIYDYEIIKRALKICIENQKTREKATTAIRKVLFKYEDDENIIMMDTYKKIIEVRNAIELHYIY